MNCLLFGLAFGIVLVRTADAPVPPTPDTPAARSVPNPQPIADPLEGISLVDTTHTAAPAADTPVRTTATSPEKLAAEVQKLASARQDVAESALSAKTPDATESIHLRLKLAELLMRLSQQKKERKAEGEISPSSQRRSRAQESESTKSSARKAKASPSEKALADKSTAGRPGSGDALHTSPAVKNPRPPERAPTNKRDLVPEGPVDPVALAQALYRTGDYEGALATYRLINPTSVDRPNRVGIQYMIATCLRKIGKKEEAATIYREVANSHDDNFLADCAKWQLSALEWRRDLETRLETLRNKNHPPEQKR